ncbi:MAG: HTTM domain-containing protein, partial [Myxococcota bacterium]
HESAYEISLGSWSSDVCCSELGMRFSWKVMVREKNGSITYRVKTKDREWQVSPSDYLDLRQSTEMSGQPDLIAKLAKHIAGDFARRGIEPVEVFVDAWVSLNGRKPARMIDPNFNLLLVDGKSYRWILPAPKEAPPSLRGLLE